jgi:hypothetical protein
MENKFYGNVKNNFGFGCMRLPMKNGEVNYEEMNKMVDLFLEAGFNYFDTAHGYLGGKSEIALRECLTKRYPREQYILTNKLTNFFFKREEDIRPLFESQLAGFPILTFISCTHRAKTILPTLRNTGHMRLLLN